MKKNYHHSKYKMRGMIYQTLNSPVFITHPFRLYAVADMDGHAGSLYKKNKKSMETPC